MFNDKIRLSKIKFNNKFDYSKAQGSKVTDKIIIICPEHGEFTQELRVHLRSLHGCTKCAGVASSIKQMKTQEAYIDEAMVYHSNKYDYSKVVYTGDANKITVICPIHGEFSQQAGSHIGTGLCGCPKCGIDASKKKQRLPKTTIIEELTSLPDTITYDINSYVDHKTKLKCNCEIHGPFEQTISILRKGIHICPSCATAARGWNRSIYKESPTTFYCLKLTNGIYKVGITKSNDVYRRYSSADVLHIAAIPFQVTFLDGLVAWDFEKNILRACKADRYVGPKIFSATGVSEMFTTNPLPQIQEELNKLQQQGVI